MLKETNHQILRLLVETPSFYPNEQNIVPVADQLLTAAGFSTHQ